jgi:hypothetical protein
MLTSFEYKCVNKQTRWVRVRRVFKVRNFRTRTSEKSVDSDSDLISQSKVSTEPWQFVLFSWFHDLFTIGALLTTVQRPHRKWTTLISNGCLLFIGIKNTEHWPNLWVSIYRAESKYTGNCTWQCSPWAVVLLVTWQQTMFFCEIRVNNNFIEINFSWKFYFSHIGWWLLAGGVSDNELSSASVTNRATERALGRSEDYWKQAMLSRAKLSIAYHYTWGPTLKGHGMQWVPPTHVPWKSHRQETLDLPYLNSNPIMWQFEK